MILLPLGFLLDVYLKTSGARPLAWLIIAAGIIPFIYFRLIMWRCPSCNHDLGNSFKGHCSNCGIKITDESKYK